MIWPWSVFKRLEYDVEVLKRNLDLSLGSCNEMARLKNAAWDLVDKADNEKYEQAAQHKKRQGDSLACAGCV